MYTSRSPSSSTLRSVLLLNKSTVAKTSRLVLLLFFLLSTSLPTQAYSYGQLKTLMSLSHSLMNRVANLRAERGDFSGSLRARKIAETLNGGGLGLRGGMWSMGLDYMKSYGWTDVSTAEMIRTVSDMEILKALNEFTQLNSNKERIAWIVRNYHNIFRIWRYTAEMFRTLSDMKPLNELTQLNSNKERMAWIVIFRISNWRDMSTAEMFRAFSDMKPLNDLTQLNSNKEGMAWIVPNFQNIFRISNWRDVSTAEMFRALSGMKALNELTQLNSNKERMAWIVTNYHNIFRISNSMFQKLLHVFSRSGPIRELVLILQEEVEGGLLVRDCLELGTKDLKGVIQIVMEIALQLSSSSEHDDL